MDPIADLEARTSAMMARYPVPEISTVDLSANPTTHFTLNPTSTKGVGIFALHDIPRGARILAEPALLSVLDGDKNSYYPRLVAALKALPEEKYAEFCALHSSFDEAAQLREWREWLIRKFYEGEAGIYPTLDPTTQTTDLHLASTFDTNAFHFNGPPAGSAVFPLTSRINHSCVPNTCGAIMIEKQVTQKEEGTTRPSDRSLSPTTIGAIMVAAAAAHTIPESEAAVDAIKTAAAKRANDAQPTDDDTRQESQSDTDFELKYTMHLRALRPIPAGTELTISYLALDTALYAERERALGRKYGFACDCVACVDERGGGEDRDEIEDEGRGSKNGKRKRDFKSENENESDKRRGRLGEILGELENREETARARGRGSGNEEEKKRALESVDEGWKLAEEEFLLGKDGAAVLGSVLAKQGLRTALSLSPADFATAFKWCKAWIINETICFGPGRGETDQAVEQWEGLVRFLVDRRLMGLDDDS